MSYFLANYVQEINYVQKMRIAGYFLAKILY